jgi:hypothetical protein
VLFAIANAGPGIKVYTTQDCSDQGTQYPLFKDTCVPFDPVYAKITCSNTDASWELASYSDNTCGNSLGGIAGNDATTCSPTGTGGAVKVNCTADPFVANGPIKLMIFLQDGCPAASNLLNASATDACTKADDIFNFPIGVYVEITCSTDEPLATATIYNDAGCLSVNQSTAQFPKGVCAPLPFSVSGTSASAIVKCGAGCLDPAACNYDAGFYTNDKTACNYTCDGGCDNTTACNYNNPDFDECYFEGDPECGCSSLTPTFALGMLLLVLAFFH